jgi:cytochrome c-type biogenesis protein CcmH/NrfF
MTSLLIATALATALSASPAATPALQEPPAEAPRAATQVPTPVPDSEKLVDRTFKGPLGHEYLVLEQSIRCNCGCGLDVHECLYQMQCGTSPKWSKRIRDELNAGYSPDVIKAGFVADFGETVLMEPPIHGFNLVGYFLPGVAILTVGTLVGLVIRGAAGRRPQVATVEPEQISDEDRARLEAELKRLEELESPDW